MALRNIVDFNEIFDILDDNKNSWYMTFGYIQTIDTSLPKVKRKNPATNRMKSYTDYSQFQEDGGSEIATIIKYTVYNLQYRDRNIVSREYGKYKQDLDDINVRYGLEPTGTRAGHRETLNYGRGIDVYSGKNDDKRQNTYMLQNVKNCKILDKKFYALDTNGQIIKEIPEESIKSFLIKNTNIASVAKLRKLNVEEEKVQQYLEEVSKLNMVFREYIHNKIVWVAATTVDDDNEKEKLLAVNHNLSLGKDAVISKRAFLDIIKNRYTKEIDTALFDELAQNISEKRSNRKLNNKRALYENIMRNVSRQVKRILNESKY